MKNIYEIAEEYNRLIKELQEIEELKKKAYIIFNQTIPLDLLMSFFEESWRRFWNYREIRKVEKYDNICILFKRCSNADVSYKELKDALKPIKKAVEDYIVSLRAKVNKTYERLSISYDYNEPFCLSSRAPSFQDPLNKKDIINFILYGIEYVDGYEDIENPEDDEDDEDCLEF